MKPFYSQVLCVTLLILCVQLGDCCLNYNQKLHRCTMCPLGTHLWKGSCIYDIDKCHEYENGADCRRCDQGYKLLRADDRIECKKLQIKETKDSIEEEIDWMLQEKDSKGKIDERVQFCQFLEDYFLQKYKEKNTEAHLVKVVDRFTHGGSHDIVMYFKTPARIEKTTSSIIGHYKTFQLKEITETATGEVPEEQIVLLPYTPVSVPLAEQAQKPQQKQLKTEQPSSPVTQPSNPDQIKQTSDFNFQYQKPDVRQKDIGFQTSDQFIRLTNNKILEDTSKVVGCFVKSSGLRKHYRLFYKTAQQQLYQGQVIYDIVRRRAYILNFGKQLMN